MPYNRKSSFLTVLNIILLCLSIYGIWILFKKYVLQKRQRQTILSVREQITEANACSDHLLSFERYFAYWNEQQFVIKFTGLRKLIKPGYEKLGLDKQLVATIEKFVSTFDQIGTVRQNYNDEFIKEEAFKYKYLFDTLEEYPLSTDQVEAVIRDEDNNLVIAGAGTGKTTTISAKVAYILEKKLARPEELLIISFTKNAVEEMRERCLKFCKQIPGTENLEVRTFNSFGYLVNRHCSQQELHLAFGGEEEAAKAFLQETFDKLFLEDADFQRKATNFIAFFNRPQRDEFKFETKNDFIKHEESFKNETLDGKKVNSKEEMEIGNFFCLFRIS
jgi:DNA helicase-4